MRWFMVSAGLLTVGIVSWLGISRASTEESGGPLVVHEWGTFTSFQDESGRSIGRVNSDDEPVPTFVHRLGSLISSSASDVNSKGIVPLHPQVTMRLETPVLYFHLPPGIKKRTVDVSVQFHGGWLTEFYPLARTSSLDAHSRLTADTVSELKWDNIQVGTSDSGPQADSVVWTAPRDVQCDAINVNGEAEKFLFYRGVGHIDAPLTVQRESSGQSLAIHQQYALDARVKPDLSDTPMWLVDVRQDGAIAWRPASLGYIASEFEAGDYSTDAKSSLFASMSDALQRDGLFEDEAHAMLHTWELSYFKSMGTRLFFLVPRQWTDAYLPLSLSVNAIVQRVMVGRIELVTPRQRALIRQLEMQAASPIVTTDSSARANQTYMSLGRFRNALLLDEQVQHPDDALKQYLSVHGIQSYVVQ